MYLSEGAGVFPDGLLTLDRTLRAGLVPYEEETPSMFTLYRNFL